MGVRTRSVCLCAGKLCLGHHVWQVGSRSSQGSCYLAAYASDTSESSRWSQDALSVQPIVGVCCTAWWFVAVPYSAWNIPCFSSYTILLMNCRGHVLSFISSPCLVSKLSKSLVCPSPAIKRSATCFGVFGVLQVSMYLEILISNFMRIKNRKVVSLAGSLE